MFDDDCRGVAGEPRGCELLKPHSSCRILIFFVYVGGAAVCDQTLSLDLLRGPVRRFWGVAAGLIHARRKPAERANSELTPTLR